MASPVLCVCLCLRDLLILKTYCVPVPVWNPTGPQDSESHQFFWVGAGIRGTADPLLSRESHCLSLKPLILTQACFPV